jgi:hypothetical protein
MVSSLLAGIPSSSWLSRMGMPRLLTRGERRRRNRLQSGRLHLGTLAGIKSERWPTSIRNRWPACFGIRTLHAERSGRRQRVLDPSHFEGIAGARRPTVAPAAEAMPVAPPAALLRPLAEYEAAAGGGWS